MQSLANQSRLWVTQTFLKMGLPRSQSLGCQGDIVSLSGMTETRILIVF